MKNVKIGPFNLFVALKLMDLDLRAKFDESNGKNGVNDHNLRSFIVEESN